MLLPDQLGQLELQLHVFYESEPLSMVGGYRRITHVCNQLSLDGWVKPIQYPQPVIEVAVALADPLCNFMRRPAFGDQTFVATGLGDGVYADVALKVFNKTG